MNLSFWKKLRKKARSLKANSLALWFAYRDPRTPWYSKLWLAIVVGYAFSPIDIIPDFIPVLGYLDDFILLPIGIAVAIRLIPEDVFRDSQDKAREWFEQQKGKPSSRVFAAMIVLFWLLLLFLISYIVLKRFTSL